MGSFEFACILFFFLILKSFGF
uniref:Uncharacterized protein n=1 Tax=Rhizophora mucronata TaxID=61149 RepID=A0A2P2MAU0_RHIMU